MIASFTAEMVELRSALEVEAREREDKMAEILEKFQQAHQDAEEKLRVWITFYFAYFKPFLPSFFFTSFLLWVWWLQKEKEEAEAIEDNLLKTIEDTFASLQAELNS